jgi:PAS domain S-box-containing protein
VEPEPDVRPDLTDDELSGAFSGHEMLVALLECAAEAIIATDGGGRIVLANRRAIEMFGYTRRELIGSPVEILLPESKRRVHIDERNRFMGCPETRPMGIGMDLAGRRKDGTEFPVEVGLSSINVPAGRFAIAFITDITRRKELEDQLLHARKMEAVGRLAGGVAHDFNNMLTVISGYNGMILDQLSPYDSLREYAEEILKASHNAAALTNRLLSFSRRHVIKLQRVNVNTILEQTEKMLRRLIGEDIELIFRLSPGIGSIYADPGQIEENVVNLVVNSRDAMPEGGRITIETSNVRLDEWQLGTDVGARRGEYVMIGVSDTGTGMDAETKRRIFEPFFTTKPQGKGTGLGLATVYGTVKQVGGDIWVHSEPGQGATFLLYFPKIASDAGTETGGDAEISSATGGSETILLVEDEESVRTLTVRMLDQLGYTTLPAGDGKHGIEIAKSRSECIDLLLTDIAMPNMSGTQLAAAITAVHPEIAVVFISAYADDTFPQQGFFESDIEFLPKPFTLESLARKLRDALAARARKPRPRPTTAKT